MKVSNESQTFMMKHKVKALWALLTLTACFTLISTVGILQSAASNRQIQMETWHVNGPNGEGVIKLPSITKWWKERKERKRAELALLNLRNRQQEVLETQSDTELKQRRSVEKEWQKDLEKFKQDEEESLRRGIEKLQQESMNQLQSQSDVYSQYKQRVIREKQEHLSRVLFEKELQQGLAELQQGFQRKKAELQQKERKKARILQLAQNSKSPRPKYNFWTEELSREDVIRLNQQGEGECPICFEEFKEGEVIKGSYCLNHSFHQACIDNIVQAEDIREGNVVLNKEKESCPMCRSSYKIADHRLFHRKHLRSSQFTPS